MLIDLDYLASKYNIQFKGILHVGAHLCEELEKYKRYLPTNKILWVEAIPQMVHQSKSMYPDILIENAVVSDTRESVTFNCANNGQSSSFLKLGTHASHYPYITYQASFTTETKLLTDFIYNYNISYNFLNFDIQGAELKALKGMEEYLPKVDYIYCEVNYEHLYVDCALISQIDEYLGKFGFKRVETAWAYESQYKPLGWGDALYIRSNA
jgi:FkbM family methyltransferase